MRVRALRPNRSGGGPALPAGRGSVHLTLKLGRRALGDRSPAAEEVGDAGAANGRQAIAAELGLRDRNAVDQTPAPNRDPSCRRKRRRDHRHAFGKDPHQRLELDAHVATQRRIDLLVDDGRRIAGAERSRHDGGPAGRLLPAEVSRLDITDRRSVIAREPQALTPVAHRRSNYDHGAGGRGRRELHAGVARAGEVVGNDDRRSCSNHHRHMMHVASTKCKKCGNVG